MTRQLFQRRRQEERGNDIISRGIFEVKAARRTRESAARDVLGIFEDFSRFEFPDSHLLSFFYIL